MAQPVAIFFKCQFKSRSKDMCNNRALKGMETV